MINKYKIPDDWSLCWDENDMCSLCNNKLVTLSQSCGDNCTQYEIRCLKCGNLESSYYED